MGEGIAGWFNNIVNYGVSIIWGNNDWLIVNNPWYGLLMFVLIGAGLYFTVATRFIQFRHFGRGSDCYLSWWPRGCILDVDDGDRRYVDQFH